MIDGDRTWAVRTKSARVLRASSRPTDIYKLDSEIGLQALGGMVVDRAGRVVGLINPDASVKEQPRRAIVPATALKNLLTAVGVNNALSRTEA